MSWKNQTSIFALVSSSNLLAIKLLGNMDFYHVSLRLFVFFLPWFMHFTLSIVNSQFSNCSLILFQLHSSKCIIHNKCNAILRSSIYACMHNSNFLDNYREHCSSWLRALILFAQLEDDIFNKKANEYSEKQETLFTVLWSGTFAPVTWR